jgi:photosystem II stability/assembly factor-like uncharacterized protein
MTSISLAPWIEQTTMGSRNNPGCAMSYDGRQILLTGFNSPIYMSTNSGTTWSTLTNLANGTYIGAASSSDGTKLVINGQGATAGYIFTSTNSGGTWTQRLTPGGPRTWTSVITSSDGSIIVGAVYNSSIFRSIDSGTTWTEVTNSNPWTVMASSNNGQKIILGTENVGVYISSNAGSTWTNKLSGVIASVSSSGDGTTMFAYVSATNPNVVYKSIDSGVTWNTLTTFPTLVNKSFSRASSSFDGKILGVGVYNDFVYLSFDSGSTWFRQTIGGTRTWTVVSVSPGSNLILAASENNSVYTAPFTSSATVNTGSIYKQSIIPEIFGNTWTTLLTDSTRNWDGDSTISRNGRQIIAVTTNVFVIYKSYNSGVTWSQQTTSHTFTSIVSSVDGRIIIATSPSNVAYISSNYGNTWTIRTSIYGWAVALSSDGSRAISCGDNSSIISTSADSGVTWTEMTGFANLLCVAISSDGQKMVAGSGGGNIYISTNTGSSWRTITNYSGITAWRGITISDDGNNIVAAATLIVTTTNSGLTWTQTNGNVGLGFQAASATSNGRYVIAVPSGGYIYTSSNFGFTWKRAVGSKSWSSCTITKDGTTMLAGEYGGYLYLSTTIINTDIGALLQTYTAGSQMNIGINILNTVKKTVGGPNSNSPAGSVMSYDGTRIVVAVEGSPNINVSTNTGNTWTAYSIGTTWAWRGLSGSSTLDKLILTGGDIGNINAYLSTNMGVLWTSRSITGTNTRVGANASSADGNKLLVVTQDGGGKIYTSTDSGLTWDVRLTNISGNWYGAASSADGNKLIATMYNGYIWTSTDAGISWTQRLTSLSAQWNGAGSSADGSVLGAINQSFVYTSMDSGVSWTQYAVNKTWYGISVSGDGNTIGAVNNSNILHLSLNKGITWRQISMDYSVGQDVAMSFDGNIISVTSNAGVFILKLKNDIGTLFNPYISGPQNTLGSVGTRTPAGVNWTQTSSYIRSWTYISSSDDGTKLAAASYNSSEIALSTDSGVTWRYVTPNANFNLGWQVASSADGSILLAGDNNKEAPPAYIYVSTNSGNTWREISSVGNEYWYSMGMSSNGQIMVAIPSQGGSGVVISTNTGNTWESRPISFGGWYRSLTVSSNGSVIIAADDRNNTGIFISTDIGITWTQRTVDGGNWYVTASSDGTKIAACKRNGYIYTSNDRGVSWTQRSLSGQRNWNYITSSADGTKLAAVVNGGYIYFSRDSGATWTESTTAGSRAWGGIASSANGSKLAACGTNTNIYTSSTVLSDVGNIFQNSILQYANGLQLEIYNGTYYDGNLSFNTGLLPTYKLNNVTNTSSLTTITNGNVLNAVFTGILTGYIVPDFTGIWTFTAGQSDDKSYIWIGPNAVYDYTTTNAIIYSNWDIPATRPTLFLTSGQYYPIRIMIGGAGGTNRFTFSYSRNGSGDISDFAGKFFS